MSLSKPSTIIYKLVEVYYNGLFNNPIRTKAISSCVIGLLGNLTSQYVAGAKRLNQDSLISFGLFGLIFGGPLPHFFFEILERIAPNEASHTILKQLFMERLVFTPLYQFLSLYMLARFEKQSYCDEISVNSVNKISIGLSLWLLILKFQHAWQKGKSHDQTLSQVMHVYLPILKANLKWLTVFQFINFAFVPPLLRVLVNNVIGFFWVIYLTHKRQQTESRRNRLG